MRFAVSSTDRVQRHTAKLYPHHKSTRTTRNTGKTDMAVWGLTMICPPVFSHPKYLSQKRLKTSDGNKTAGRLYRNSSPLLAEYLPKLPLCLKPLLLLHLAQNVPWTQMCQHQPDPTGPLSNVQYAVRSLCINWCLYWSLGNLGRGCVSSVIWCITLQIKPCNLYPMSIKYR